MGGHNGKLIECFELQVQIMMMINCDTNKTICGNFPLYLLGGWGGWGWGEWRAIYLIRQNPVSVHPFRNKSV